MFFGSSSHTRSLFLWLETPCLPFHPLVTLLQNPVPSTYPNMFSKVLTVAAATAVGVNAARPYLNEPDTGILDVLGDLAVGSLPELDQMVGLPDFDWAARNYLPIKN